MDLKSRLTDMTGPAGVPAAETIDADLARGRRALRRRHRVQAVTGSMAAVAVAAAAVAVFGTSGPTSPSAPVAAPPASAANQLRLVAYQGAKPKNFTVDRVPDGFFIQSDDNGGLMIAPDELRNPGPDVDPSADTRYDPSFYTGKIGVFLEQTEFRGPVDGDALVVGGRPAVLHKADKTWQLIIKQAPNVQAVIQFDVPLSREQMLELGAGLHVDQAAIDRKAQPVTVTKHD